MTKEQLRSEIMKRRDEIKEEWKKSWSEEIIRQVILLPAFQKASHVLSYASFRSEVITDKLNEWCIQEGKHLFLPRTEPSRRTMDFYEVKEMSSLVPGYQGIREPAGGIPFSPEQKKAGETICMVMPGVAYDEEGNRIGYGGGYYDRYLARYGKYIDESVMVAYDVQRVSLIPKERCDVRPSRIVTNRTCVNRR